MPGLDNIKIGTNLKEYYVPAGSLGFSVVVFFICAVCCVICLLARRKVVGGELDGSQIGRASSAIFLSSLWLLYVIVSTLQAYGKAGLDKVSIGDIAYEDLSPSVQYWKVKCGHYTLPTTTPA